MTQNKKGFTLIELMVVMAIIAVLAVLMIGAIQLARSTATETTHRSNGKTVQTALEANFAKYRYYCGAGTIACNTAGLDTNVGSLNAAASTLNVTLGATTCSTGYEGGGTLHVEPTKYWIRIQDSACTGTQLPAATNDIKANY